MLKLYCSTLLFVTMIQACAEVKFTIVHDQEITKIRTYTCIEKYKTEDGENSRISLKRLNVQKETSDTILWDGSFSRPFYYSVCANVIIRDSSLYYNIIEFIGQNDVVLFHAIVCYNKIEPDVIFNNGAHNFNTETNIMHVSSNKTSNKSFFVLSDTANNLKKLENGVKFVILVKEVDTTSMGVIAKVRNLAETILIMRSKILSVCSIINFDSYIDLFTDLLSYALHIIMIHRSQFVTQNIPITIPTEYYTNFGKNLSKLYFQRIESETKNIINQLELLNKHLTVPLFLENNQKNLRVIKNVLLNFISEDLGQAIMLFKKFYEEKEILCIPISSVEDVNTEKSQKNNLGIKECLLVKHFNEVIEYFRFIHDLLLEKLRSMAFNLDFIVKGISLERLKDYYDHFYIALNINAMKTDDNKKRKLPILNKWKPLSNLNTSEILSILEDIKNYTVIYVNNHQLNGGLKSPQNFPIDNLQLSIKQEASYLIDKWKGINEHYLNMGQA